MQLSFLRRLLMGTSFLMSEAPGGAAAAADPAGAAAAALAAPAAAAVVPPPAAAPTIGVDGNPVQALWYDGLTEQPVKDLMAAKGYKTPQDVALAYYSLNKDFSGRDPNAIIVPGENATPEQVAAYHDKIGVPKTAGEYQFNFGDRQTDPKMVEFAKGLSHKLSLPPAKAAVLVEEYNKFSDVYAQELEAKYVEDTRKANDAEVETLKTTYGAEFDKNVVAGRRVVQTLGLPDALLSKIETHAGSAAMLELFFKLGQQGASGSFVAGGEGATGAVNPATMNSAQAQAEITRLRGSEDFNKKFNDKNHPEHADAVKKMEALYLRL